MHLQILFDVTLLTRLVLHKLFYSQLMLVTPMTVWRRLKKSKRLREILYLLLDHAGNVFVYSVVTGAVFTIQIMHMIEEEMTADENEETVNTGADKKAKFNTKSKKKITFAQ